MEPNRTATRKQKTHLMSFSFCSNKMQEICQEINRLELNQYISRMHTTLMCSRCWRKKSHQFGGALTDILWKLGLFAGKLEIEREILLVPVRMLFSFVHKKGNDVKDENWLRHATTSTSKKELQLFVFVFEIKSLRK